MAGDVESLMRECVRLSVERGGQQQISMSATFGTLRGGILSAEPPSWHASAACKPARQRNRWVYAQGATPAQCLDRLARALRATPIPERSSR